MLSLAGVGNGCPDLLVGAKRVNVLLELKDDKKPPSARKLTPDEVTFLASWRGQYAVVENEVQAVAAVRAVLSGVFL